MSVSIAILDDDIMTANTLASIAEYCELETTVFVTPEDFLSSLGNWQPDLIALDLNMPRIDGVEVLSRLARNGCRAAIIIVTAMGGKIADAAKRSARERGLNILGCLAKPFTAKAFQELIDSRPLSADEGSPWIDKIGSWSAFGYEELAEFLETSDVDIAMQPQISCVNHLIKGFEALARIEHPSLGVIPPEHFIAVAEKGSLINKLTESVIFQSLNWLDSLSVDPELLGVLPGAVSKLNALTISINISALCLEDEALFEKMINHCAELGISPDRIILELTETSTMQDPTLSLETLTRLRMQGFHLSLDDFGTGFSSMLQLVRMPLTEMKVDKSFVMQSMNSVESREVVRSIVELGNTLNLQVVAEGVEDRETKVFLEEMGCHLLQGFYIARPMPLNETNCWLQQHFRSWERKRLEGLKKVETLNALPKKRFDRHTRLAKRLFEVSTALVCLLGDSKQWIKSAQGFDITESDREVSFCSHTILLDEVLVVEDARADERFMQNPLVVGPPQYAFLCRDAVDCT